MLKSIFKAVAVSAVAAVFSIGCDGGGDGGNSTGGGGVSGLTITGVPSGIWNVLVFPAGTDISNYDLASLLSSDKIEASSGGTKIGNLFPLLRATAYDPNDYLWTGSGRRSVAIYEYPQVIYENTEFQWYWATVNFSNGNATVPFSSFTLVDVEGTGGGTHNHTYSSTWSSNATQHWRECTANDGAKTDVANHTFNGNICSVCNYNNGGGTGGPTNWTAVSNSTFGASSISSVAYGNNTWVAVGAGGNSVDGKIAYSTDNGRTWTEATQTIFVRGGFSEINVVTFDNGMFIAASGAKMAYSTDGINWTAITFPFRGGAHIRCIAYGNGMWVLVAQAGNTAYSTDGINWTAGATDALSGNIYKGGIVFNNNRFVAVCNGKMAYTSDGQSWTAVSNTGFSTGNILGIAFGNNRYVAVGSSGPISYSSDGTSWTAVTPNPGGFNAIAFGNNRFVAVGDNGRMAYSANGTSAWTTIGNTGFGTTNNDYIFNVAYGNGRFVAVGASGKIAYADW